MKVIGYIRVSTDKQAKDGESLLAQRAKIEAYATLYDLEVVEIVADEGQSAKTLDRPGIKRALQMIDNGEADGLLVSKLDRLTRSVKDLCTLMERFQRGRVELLSVAEKLDTSTASGRLVMNILAVVAQWEREVIAERTSEIFCYMKEQELYTGGHIRYGYRLADDEKKKKKMKKLEPEPLEQEVLGVVKALHQIGMGFRATARELNSRGYRTRRGTEFHAAQIKKIIGGNEVAA